MNILIIIGIAVTGIIAGLTVWEILLKAAGGTVVLSENAWLMRQWRKTLTSRGEEYRDPVNLCQMFQYVFGVRKAGHIGHIVGNAVLDAVLDVVLSEELVVRCGVTIVAASLILLGIVEVVLILMLGVYLVYPHNSVLQFFAQSAELNRVAVAIGLGGMVLFAAFYVSVIKVTAFRVFAAKLMTFWLKVCPPVSVRSPATKL